MNATKLITATVALFALALTGCVLRKESITIRPDGSFTFEVETEGTRQELKSADAFPTRRGGWEVEERTEVDREGKEKQHLHARREWPAGAEFPFTYADMDDPDLYLALRFPTTLDIERRRDGIYYTFRRSYARRPWAYIQHWHDEIFDDDFRQATEKDVENLTLEERREIVEAFAMFEALKQLEFAGNALKTAMSDLRVEHGLIARQAVLDYYEKEQDNFTDILDGCNALADEDATGQCLEQAAENILATAHETWRDSLRNTAGLTSRDLDFVDLLMRKEQALYNRTNAIGGHLYEVIVTMPGTIIAHNAREFNESSGDEPGSVSFQFAGSRVRDNDLELIVVSRVDYDSVKTPGR